MRRFLMILLLLAVLPACADGIEKGRIVKMLPLFLDLKGHDAISPSLYDRDAYQAYLRRHTNEISAIRFDFLWQVANPSAAKYKLRIELQWHRRGWQAHPAPCWNRKRRRRSCAAGIH